MYSVLDAKVRVLVVGHAQIAGGKKTRASKSNAPAPSFPFAAVIGSRPAGTVLSRRPPLESKKENNFAKEVQIGISRSHEISSC